uniref:Uncharacterized protein n=1 Tax=Molossus molossus TaxID=27622 RepID=A0A7J8I7M0_MOLMO|nr:hypothetical protein HJG59_010515 [Molossus molossus]
MSTSSQPGFDNLSPHHLVSPWAANPQTWTLNSGPGCPKVPPTWRLQHKMVLSSRPLRRGRTLASARPFLPDQSPGLSPPSPNRQLVSGRVAGSPFSIHIASLTPTPSQCASAPPLCDKSISWWGGWL